MLLIAIRILIKCHGAYVKLTVSFHHAHSHRERKQAIGRMDAVDDAIRELEAFQKQMCSTYSVPPPDIHNVINYVRQANIPKTFKTLACCCLALNFLCHEITRSCREWQVSNISPILKPEDPSHFISPTAQFNDTSLFSVTFCWFVNNYSLLTLE